MDFKGRSNTLFRHGECLRHVGDKIINNLVRKILFEVLYLKIHLQYKKEINFFTSFCVLMSDGKIRTCTSQLVVWCYLPLNYIGNILKAALNIRVAFFTDTNLNLND
jgi:hypothetical protein